LQRERDLTVTGGTPFAGSPTGERVRARSESPSVTAALQAAVHVGRPCPIDAHGLQLAA